MFSNENKKGEKVGLKMKTKEEKTAECVEALRKCGLIEPDMWFVLELVGGSELGHTVEGFVNVLTERSLNNNPFLEEAGKEGRNFKWSNGAIYSPKPTRALLKEFMCLMGFLVWNDVVDFGVAKEARVVESHKLMKKTKQQPSDALLSWMSGIRVPVVDNGVEESVNFPELSIYLMNQAWGIHDGDSLKECLKEMVDHNDSHKLWKWIPEEHMVALTKAAFDFKATSVPEYEVDLLFHSPGEVQRRELVHLLEKMGLTNEEVARMMWRDALDGDCSHAVFVSFCKACFVGKVECPIIRERKMTALMRACVFMQKGMDGVLKVDRILRFGHSEEFQRMAERCQLPKVHTKRSK